MVNPSALLLTIALIAQPAQDRVLGLLTLPQVFGSRMCAPFEPKDVSLHTTPDEGSRFAVLHVDQTWSFAPHGGCDGLEVSIHRGSQREQLPTLEYDYEMPAAIVLEQRNGWFRVRLAKGSAWIKAGITDRFLPLSDLFEEFIGTTMIDKAFTGRLLSAPGVLATGANAMTVKPLQSVQVIELREVDGESFVKIELMSHALCTAAVNGPPEVLATGWLPMHAPTGEPTLWFTTRGC